MRTDREYNLIINELSDSRSEISKLTKELDAYKSYDRTWKSMCEDYQQRSLKSEHALQLLNEQVNYIYNKTYINVIVNTDKGLRSDIVVDGLKLSKSVTVAKNILKEYYENRK